MSSQLRVELVHSFAEPYNNAVATARTCYSSRIITSADVSKDDKSRAQRDEIAKSTYEAGHHTTLQHATFQFAISGISRHCLWSFLHAHPYYNSEQVSQRYVSVKPNTMYLPDALQGSARDKYMQCAQLQMQTYLQLVEILMPTTAEAYFQIFPARRKHADQHQGAIKKKAQEIARYCLPIGTFAHLYHTISGLTLHRYQRLANMLDVPHETAALIQAMVQAVQQHDPLFTQAMQDPIPLEQTLEYQALASLERLHVNPSAKTFCEQFDRELDGKLSKLIDYKANAEAVMARSVRTMLGLTAEQITESQAIEWVLSASKNQYLAGALNLNSLSKLTRAMVHPHFTFQKKLSHTADSQEQRHRTTPGTRPILHTHYAGGSPDVIMPALMLKNQQAHDIAMQCYTQTWQTIDALLNEHISPENALYLLPNAFPIRFEESGDLTGFLHKWTTRLCLNAQEEIWHATLQEVEALKTVHPIIARYVHPPCGVRRDGGMRPLCPEGSRFCGIPVWKYDLSQFERML